MTHQAKDSEQLYVFSMGKRFRVRAIATSDDEANGFMLTHADTGLIACFGPFNVIADLYTGVRERGADIPAHRAMTDERMHEIVQTAFAEINNDSPEAAWWAVKMALREAGLTSKGEE